MKRVPLGAAGEAMAVEHLVAAGYQIRARNVRLPGGEIDVVAVDRETLVFVEVKTRSGSAYGDAAEAVDHRKRAKLAALAALYLQRTGESARACRFDVVTVQWRSGRWQVEILPNAFAT